MTTRISTTSKPGPALELRHFDIDGPCIVHVMGGHVYIYPPEEEGCLWLLKVNTSGEVMSETLGITFVEPQR